MWSIRRKRGEGGCWWPNMADSSHTQTLIWSTWRALQATASLMSKKAHWALMEGNVIRYNSNIWTTKSRFLSVDRRWLFFPFFLFLPYSSVVIKESYSFLLLILQRSPGIDGCDQMCCDRGYNTRMERRVERCKCKFHWCCFVHCEECFREVEVSTCKWAAADIKSTAAPPCVHLLQKSSL